MKIGLLFCVSLLALRCGASSPGAGTAEASLTTDTAAALSPESNAPAGNDPSPQQGGFAGAWENASCGDRQYRRQINFNENGSFQATDFVAPCPPNAQCIWSGIIHWHGSWTLTDRTITLKTEPVTQGKPPEQVPETFVILSTDPLSIGEQIGDVVCPYKLK